MLVYLVRVGEASVSEIRRALGLGWETAKNAVDWLVANGLAVERRVHGMRLLRPNWGDARVRAVARLVEEWDLAAHQPT